MPATSREASDQIFALFAAAWALTGHTGTGQVEYEGKRNDPPTDASSKPQIWVRASIRHLDGGQASLSSNTGSQRFGRRGIFVAQIFTPDGNGYGLGRDLATAVLAGFYKKTTAGGLFFRNHQLREIGRDGQWLHVQARVDFEYDEIV